MQSYRDLIAWQKAMDLVEVVYRATWGWPKEEAYGLTSQLRRAAVSIPANVAEGKGRTVPNEFLHRLSIAHGSLCELETHLLIAAASPIWTTQASSYFSGKQRSSGASGRA